MNQKEYRNKLAEAFIHVLEEKQLEWHRGWAAMNPVNAVKGNRYNGINRLYLSLIGEERKYQDPRWATFKQIQDKGWKLENAKGQGVHVEYWYPYDLKERRAMTWEEYRKRDDADISRYTFYSKYAVVFNGSLIQGIPKLEPTKKAHINQEELVKSLSDSMEVPILHDGRDRAYYKIVDDTIHLPMPEYFESEYEYNSTALHELAHATGAPQRLNRNLSGCFGSEEYAYEELVAEISSCFMCENLQTVQSESHINNHKAYVQDWCNAIRKNPEVLIKAVKQAEQTASYMEYKAGLLPEKEYQKVKDSSMEVKRKSKEPEQMQDKPEIQQVQRSR